MIEIALSIVLGFFNLVSLKFVPPLELKAVTAGWSMTTASSSIDFEKLKSAKLRN